MISEKARLCGDNDAYIVESCPPTTYEPKKLWARTSSTSINEEWERQRGDVVLTGSYAKFAQNGDMQQHVLDTGIRTLGEASLSDPLRGVGMPVGHPQVTEPSA